MQTDTVQVLITAAEAYPAFERMVLAAKKDVWISLRIFDPTTHLYSDEARAIGTTWADLLRHKLDEGVRFNIVITDFDPVARPELHELSWRCRDDCIAAAKASKHPDRLEVDVHMHPARVGWAHRLLFMPVTRRKLRDECNRLIGMDRKACDDALEHRPRFRQMIRHRSGKLWPRLWPPAPLVPATHHQKMAVADGKVLYIGGLDLNPRRYDDLHHRRAPEKTWHDVQVIATGEAAKAGLRHIKEFRQVTAGEAQPSPYGGVLRTLSCDVPGGRRLAPHEVLRELEEAHLRLIRTAKRYIFIETQFLRSTPITDALVTAAAAQPDLQLMVLLPAAPEDVAFDSSDDLDAKYGEQLQSTAVKRLRDAYGDRVFFGSPAQPRRMETEGRDTHFDAPIIYIHAKVIVTDDRTAIVSSANLNGRSMRWDSETGVELADPAIATKLFRRCCDHWFPNGDPGDMTRAETWNRAATDNSRREPAERPHFILPYDEKLAAEMGEPIPGVPEEMV
ncbi:MAG: phospholipase D-like domain-containing protein [Pseudomonadota bacterium]|nr:phospholipase D-like domain-containing protein [Pseudomonadota bacterium]